MKSLHLSHLPGALLRVLLVCSLVAGAIIPNPHSVGSSDAQPLVSAAVHAALLELPARNASQKEIAVPTASHSLFAKLRNRLTNSIRSATVTNGTTTVTKDIATVTNATATEAWDNVTNLTTSRHVDDLAVDSHEHKAHNKITERNDGREAYGMRMNSFVEGISSAVHDIGSSVQKIFTHPKSEGYSIVSQNNTWVVAHVSGRQLRTCDKVTGRGMPVRVVFHKRQLTVEVEEMASTRTNNTIDLEDEWHVAGLGTEYRFILRKHKNVDVDGVYLQQSTGDKDGYSIVIPLLAENWQEDMNVTSHIPGENDGHDGGNNWGTIHEEDRYEFLQSQLACQKEHGRTGVKRMLCTCERVHAHNMVNRLLCVSRVANKVVRTAKSVGAMRIARRVERKGGACNRGKRSIQARHDCLIKLLYRIAGEKSAFHMKHGRMILSEQDVVRGGIIEEALAKEKMAEEDIAVEVDVGKKEESVREKVVRAIMLFGYVVAISLLVVCVYDLSKQYWERKHNWRSGSSCVGA